MSARDSIENLWDRSYPVAKLLDAYRDEILREAADKIRTDARERKARSYSDNAVFELKGGLMAADLITNPETRCQGCGEPADSPFGHGVNQGFGGCV